MEKVIPTGSVAQDALRAGFQTTCAKGIATLLKVDDITVEACAALEQKHKDALAEHLNGFEQRYVEKLTNDFKEHQSYISYRHLRIDPLGNVSNLVGRSWKPQEACSQELLQRIINGVCISRLTPREFKAIFGCR